ncbi:hypothetical protein TRVL_05906 [Trypanosoma vivax]|nr:hypothetical protein TRVL_05906 [Trypanosoma vivax]
MSDKNGTNHAVITEQCVQNSVHSDDAHGSFRELFGCETREEAWEQVVREILLWVSGALRGNPFDLHMIELLLRELDDPDMVVDVNVMPPHCRSCGALVKSTSKGLWAPCEETSSGPTCISSCAVGGSNCEEQRCANSILNETSFSDFSSGVMGQSERVRSCSRPAPFRNPRHPRNFSAAKSPERGTGSMYCEGYMGNKTSSDFYTCSNSFRSSGNVAHSPAMSFITHDSHYYNYYDIPYGTAAECYGPPFMESSCGRGSSCRFQVLESDGDRKTSSDYFRIHAADRLIPADPNDRWPFE